MQFAMALAFLMIAAAPLIGIWQGHAWAKANGLVLHNDQKLQGSNPASEGMSQLG